MEVEGGVETVVWAEDKEPGSVSKGQVKLPKLQSVFWRGSTCV